MDGMPPIHILRYWMESHKDFREQYKAAKKFRAEYYADLVAETADQTNKKSQVGPAKVKLSAWKWLAEKGNPEDYGNKTVVEGGKPIRIMIDTGIRRPEIEVKSKVEDE
jgi:hypothetical protein